jgi:hypothetical protein
VTILIVIDVRGTNVNYLFIRRESLKSYIIIIQLVEEGIITKTTG